MEGIVFQKIAVPCQRAIFQPGGSDILTSHRKEKDLKSAVGTVETKVSSQMAIEAAPKAPENFTHSVEHKEDDCLQPDTTKSPGELVQSKMPKKVQVQSERGSIQFNLQFHLASASGRWLLLRAKKQQPETQVLFFDYSIRYNTVSGRIRI